MKKGILAGRLLSVIIVLALSLDGLAQPKNGNVKKETGRSTTAYSLQQDQLKLLTDDVFSLSEVMLHDVANPPAASRFYAYCLLGAYESVFYAKGSLPDINKSL